MTDFSDAFEARLNAATIADRENPERDKVTKAIGAGVLGHPNADKPWDRGCERRIYYEWQKIPKDDPAAPKFPARLYRVFDMGHDSEARMAAYLRNAGLVLKTHRPEEERIRLGLHSPQYGFAMVKGFLKGKLDGILVGWKDGVEVGGDLAKLQFPSVWEHKGLGDKQFKELKKKGLEAAHPGYFGQVQLNMAAMKLHGAPALFTAVNRTTGDVDFCLIKYDAAAAQAVSDRAVRILRAVPDNGGGGVTDLAKAADAPDQMPCRFCGHKERCHNKDTARAALSPTTAAPKPAWL